MRSSRNVAACVMDITVGGNKIKGVTSLCYLGSNIIWYIEWTVQRGYLVELSFCQMGEIFLSDIILSRKRLLKANVWNTTLYRRRSWTIDTLDEQDRKCGTVGKRLELDGL